MIEDKKYIRLPKPEEFLDSRMQLRKLGDNQWKQHIFFHILKFYKEIDNNQVINLINKEKRKPQANKEKRKPRAEIEEAIKKFIVKQLKNDKRFDTHGFIVNREPSSEHSGFYDLKFEHSDWRGKYFSFECKNLGAASKASTTSTIKEYVYNKSTQDGGVYRYMIGKYARDFNFGGMIGFIIKGETDIIIEEIIKKLHRVSNDNIGKLTDKSIVRNSIENNKNTFNSIHIRAKGNKEFTLHHIMMNFSK
ncbi:MAG: hypothetical protein JRJ49_09420 [Deltaproteobacteria bacterium]|nr:hypothetical protein [Deltaproteobacteria bacterium]